MPPIILATRGPLLAAGLIVLGLVPGIALAQQGVDFGDDSSIWANDGECDDPRFQGTGMAVELLEEDTLRDATDCRTLFQAGSIILGPGITDPVDPDAPPAPGAGPAAGPAAGAAGGAKPGASPRPEARPAAGDVVDFGDDSSAWANDGECDDPRFTGTGMAEVLLDEDARKDATDCRRLFEAGAIRLVN